jgi:hypothetical protein
MVTRRSSFRRPVAPRFAFALAVAITAACVIGLQAQQWPVLKQGMWEFTRTMQAPGGGAPRTVTSKRCTDPTADMQRQNATLTKSGCTISAPVKKGNTYTFTAACNVMGVSSNTTSTLVVESESAYSLTVEGTTDGQPTKEAMKAVRIGDCTK